MKSFPTPHLSCAEEDGAEKSAHKIRKEKKKPGNTKSRAGRDAQNVTGKRANVIENNFLWAGVMGFF
jgi:hypothetical protein